MPDMPPPPLDMPPEPPPPRPVVVTAVAGTEAHAAGGGGVVFRRFVFLGDKAGEVDAPVCADLEEREHVGEGLETDLVGGELLVGLGGVGKDIFVDSAVDIGPFGPLVVDELAGDGRRGGGSSGRRSGP